MRRSITRAMAGAAVAAATVLALAGPASASPTLPRLHTTLSIVESKSVITAGQTDEVSGRLVHAGVGLGGRNVYLYRLYGTTLVLKQVEVTGPAGWAAFTVRPGITARFELVYKGNAVYAPTHSGIVTVKVMLPPPSRAHTTLSIVESKSVIEAGQTDEVSGRLDAHGAGLGGRLVYLYRVYGTTLVQKQVLATGPAGGVVFTVTPGITARFELVYKGSAAYFPTHSGIVTVKVIP
jgi:hypothetical protein